MLLNIDLLPGLITVANGLREIASHSLGKDAYDSADFLPFGALVLPVEGVA